jgi:2-methylisocitrate lyase-like PEP mutase family enzyme
MSVPEREPKAAADTFRALHHGPRALVIPNAWDALSARIVESCGATAIATPSAALAWSHGKPDGQFLSLDTLVSTVRETTAAVSIPVSVDLERGWSDDPAAVVDAVARVVDAGAVGVNLEDGAFAPELLARKIRACKANASTAHVFVNARTDVFIRGLCAPEHRVSEVCARARLYADAGADGLFVPRIVASTDIQTVTSATALPVNVLAVPGVPSVTDLSSLGVRRLSVGPRLAEAAFTAMRRAWVELSEHGTYARLFDSDLTFADINALFPAPTRRNPASS